MLKSAVLGLGICVTLAEPLPRSIAPAGASEMPVEVAQASPAPFVTEICPGMVWAEGFRIGEKVPLAPEQYHPAMVIATAPLRSGYGFEGPIITNLTTGATVTVMGEVWDLGCNQWMVVPVNGSVGYIHGNALQNL